MDVRSDLTGFSALLGDSFASRIDLLEQIIRSAHYPSLGSYKERILIETIRKYLPKSVEVGTGFIMFPLEEKSPADGPTHHDPLNQSAFTVSHQCDILVYDAMQYPVVFRDGDFVVIRPEATRAIIEVKGSISGKSLRTTLESFYDLAKKWKATQVFYKEHFQALTKSPYLGLMAWAQTKQKNGRATTSIKRLRESIAQFYRDRISAHDLDALPLLDDLYVYATTQISKVVNLENSANLSMGWASDRGKFILFDNNQDPYEDRDRTIAALLAALHAKTEWKNFNRFFSYTDITRRNDILPYGEQGYTAAWAIQGDGTFHRSSLDD